MLTPKKFKELERNKIISMYDKINRDTIASIINKLEDIKELNSYTISQINSIARNGGIELLNEILDTNNKISRKRKNEIKKLINIVIKEEMDFYKNTYKTNGKQIRLSYSANKVLKSVERKTNKELVNLTRTIAFRANEQFKEAISDMYLKVISGNESFENARKQVINNLISKGITLENKGVKHTIEAVVKTNVMTSLTQIANEVSRDVGEKIGANCVVIHHTPYCRPTHRVIDGVVMSLKLFNKYKYLTEEYNCYHIVNYDWRKEFEGIDNKIEYNGHLTQREYDKNYELRQKQNYYARQVREKKNDISILKKTNDTNNLKKSKNELSLAQLKYRTFCKKNKIEVDYTLTWKGGYNK